MPRPWSIAMRRMRAGRAGRVGAQGCFYVGRRADAAEVHVVTPGDVGRLRHLGYRSESPFEWSPSTDAGAVELAFAILSHATRRRSPDSVCAQFRAEIIATLPPDGFVIGGDDIRLWLAAERRDANSWPSLISRGRGEEGAA